MNILSNLPIEQLTKTIVDYPLSLNAVKRHLRLDNDFVDDDAYLMDLLKAATQYTEGYINKALTKTLNVLRIDDFCGDSVQIYEGNFLSLVSVKDANDTSIGTVKQTSAHYDYFTIEWTDSIASDPLTITFYTGFEIETCPEVIKQAILIKVATLYDDARSSYSFSGMTDNKVFEALLQPYVSYRF